MSGTISYTGGLGGIKSGKERASKCRHFSLSPLQEGIPSAPPRPPQHLEPGKPSRKPTSCSYQLFGSRDKKMMLLSPTVYSRGNGAEGCSYQVQWTLMSKALPGSWKAVYVSAFVVYYCTVDFWTTSSDHFPIVYFSCSFPLDL